MNAMNIKIKHQYEDSLKFPPAYYSSLCNMKSMFESPAENARLGLAPSPVCLPIHPSEKLAGYLVRA